MLMNWLVTGISGTKFYKEGRLSQPVPKFYTRDCKLTELPLNVIKICELYIGEIYVPKLFGDGIL